MKTTVVANQKGGVAKSTTAAHMVFHHSDSGSRVLFIDLDPQGNSSSSLLQAFGEAAGTSAQMFEPDADQHIQLKQVAILRADSQALVNLESSRAASVESFCKNIEVLGKHFDFCVIDTSPTVSMTMEAALSATDYVLSPIQLNQYSIDGIQVMMTVITNIKRQRNPKLAFLGMLPSIVKGNSPDQQATLQALQTNYSQLVLPVKVSDRQAIPQALNEGKPVWRLQRHSTSVREAAKEMKAVFELLDQKMGVK